MLWYITNMWRYVTLNATALDLCVLLVPSFIPAECRFIDRIVNCDIWVLTTSLTFLRQLIKALSNSWELLCAMSVTIELGGREYFAIPSRSADKFRVF
jgi:hypothetical protein